MDSRKLEILMTAVDLGSFSKAAEVVGYTQSGLTHLVDSLEREIGLTLVQRDHSGIALTEEGNALMPAIREFLRANARLENQISAITEKSAQTIRVAAYASIAMRWMPEILYRFRRVCPQCFFIQIQRHASRTSFFSQSVGYDVNPPVRSDFIGTDPLCRDFFLFQRQLKPFQHLWNFFILRVQHLFISKTNLEKVVPCTDFQPAVLFCLLVQALPRFHTAAVVMIVPAA